MVIHTVETDDQDSSVEKNLAGICEGLL